MSIEMISNSEGGKNAFVSKRPVETDEIPKAAEYLESKYSIYEWRIKNKEEGRYIYIKGEEKK